MKYANFGSVSQGTLLNADLLDSFSYELHHQLGRQSTRFKRARYRKLIRQAASMLKAHNVELSDQASDLIYELTDALSEFAPPYGYFGAIDGDNSDFGFYVDDPRESGFDGLAVADLSEVPREYRGEVIHINDHGNMSLYVTNGRGKLREIWAVV